MTEELYNDCGIPPGWFDRLVASEIDLLGFPIVVTEDAPKLVEGDILIARPTIPQKFADPPLNMADGLHGDSDADTFRTRERER